MSMSSVIRSANLQVAAGCELLDTDDNLVEDISEDLVDGTITRRNLATVHGTCSLRLSRPLSWQANRLRPYVTLTDLLTGESYRWDLGVYLPETPARRTGRTPAEYEVQGFDKLAVLNTPYGSTYRLAAGSPVIAAVEALIAAAGESLTSIDPTSASASLPYDRVFPIDASGTTSLRICNDLLGAIGYRGLYVDRNGYYRSEPYLSPSGRAAVWTYDTADPETIVVDPVEVEEDLFSVPNVWVFIRDNPDPTLPLPSEGNGLYTVTNQADGITSIDSRGGRIVRAVVPLDAADQAALVVQGDRRVEADKSPTVYLAMTTGPNPAHWHSEVVMVTSSDLGLTGARFLEREWTLPLDGGPMEHKFVRVVT